MKYNIYAIEPRLACYRGLSLVAANSVEEANHYIDEYKKNDPHNYLDSGGFSEVNKYDIIEGVYSENSGIVYNGISYYG